jgi:beta-galactosidase/beta-glucuronidase
MQPGEPLHPRPQFARDRWVDLGGPWGFAYDDDDAGLAERWYRRDDVFVRTIQVPFPPESKASGIHDTGFHPVVWYRRTFDISGRQSGERVLLHCGAIDYRARIWINGSLVAIHEGGHTPIDADITGALTPEGGQVIVIRAEDRPHDLEQPRGKQDWQEAPHDIWYHRTTGIWQPVWLEYAGPSYITALIWTPTVERDTLGVALRVANPNGLPNLRVHIRLTLRGETLANEVLSLHDEGTRAELSLERAHTTMDRQELLWHPQHPNLIGAEVSLIDGGTVLDIVHSYAGLRDVRISDGRYLLNGEPLYLRMVLEQGYWPDSHLAAPSADALRTEVERVQELGFNGVRIHQKIEDPRFLYWCDALGLLVWGEMANAYAFSAESVRRLIGEWQEVLERDRSHPCIVAWVPMNESWGAPNLPEDAAQRDYVRALYHLTKALDPTRPAIANDGWEHIRGDMLTIHDYTPSPEAIRARYATREAIDRTLREFRPGGHVLDLSGADTHALPVVLSELGGIGLKPREGEPWYGYTTVDDTDAFLARYRDLIDAVLDCEALAGFCYTQLTDTLQETNGLLTANREPKVDPAQIRAITRD